MLLRSSNHMSKSTRFRSQMVERGIFQELPYRPSIRHNVTKRLNWIQSKRRGRQESYSELKKTLSRIQVAFKLDVLTAKGSQAATLLGNSFAPKLRKDSRTLYEGKLRRLDERISVSPSTSSSSNGVSSEIRTLLCSNGGFLDDEEPSEQDSTPTSFKKEPAVLQHCRPRLGRKPRFLTDDSIVEAFERGSPQLFSGPPESPNQVDHMLKHQLGPTKARDYSKFRSTSSIATAVKSGQSRPSIADQPLTSTSSASSQDIADQQQSQIELSKQIGSSPTPRLFEGFSLRESLESPWTASHTSWRKPSGTLRSSLSMPRMRGTHGKGKPNHLGGNRKRSLAHFFASINTPIRQWSFAERWGHSKDGKIKVEQSMQHGDSSSMPGGGKQSVSDAINFQKDSVTDGSGRSRESSQETAQEKTCYVSFEEPRRLSRRIRRSSNAFPLRKLGSSSRSDESDLIEYTETQGRIRGLSVIVTLDGGAEVVVDARVSGHEWNIKGKNRTKSSIRP